MKVVFAYFFLVFGLGLNYLFNILVAREMGIDYFGNYTYALYIFNITSLIAVFSLDQAAVKFIPQRIGQQGQITKTLQLFAFSVSVLVSIIYFLAVRFFLNPQFESVYILFGCLIFPFVLITLNTAILQSYQIVIERMALRYFYEPVFKILLFYLLLHSVWKEISPVTSFLLALVVVNAIAFLRFKNLLVNPLINLKTDQKREIFSYCLSLSVTNIIVIVSSRLDLLILGNFVPTRDLGIYAAAFQTAAMLSVVLQGIETIYVPILSKHIADNNKNLLTQDFQLCLRWSLIFSAPILLVFLTYPEVAVLPFGNAFKNLAPILFLLCVGQLFVLVLGGTSNILLSLMGFTKEVFFIGALQIFLSSILLVLGAKYFGVLGAATSVAITLVCISLIRGLMASKKSGIAPYDKYFLKAAFVFSLTLILGIVFKKEISLLGIVAMPVVFFSLLWAMGIHPTDKEKLLFTLEKIKALSK